MAELVFYCGTMDCGKSTLALQIDHNYRARGREGLIFTQFDRAGESVLSSRLGLATPAREVTPGLDFWEELVAHLTTGHRADHLICDEAQFYTPDQVGQLARVVDELGIEVHAFGITSDFRTMLFPGSKRLVELADRVQVLQVEALCWCGRRATHNARVLDGIMVVEGEQVVVGDTGETRAAGGSAGSAGSAGSGGSRGSVGSRGYKASGVIEYEVLCRRHFMRRMTSSAALATRGAADTLPFDLDVCPVPPPG
ncbi:MAG TPA: thymidine kinase [Dermatophilaceae bacterium]|nr:thymidine kinase [Dermatophilaceae bacterium]